MWPDPDFALDEITYAPTITQPNKILCIGLNYKAHQEETGRGGEGVPTVFTRFAAAQIGHNQEMLRPKESGALDFEGEIAMIIGKGVGESPKKRPWSTLLVSVFITTVA